MDKAELSGFIQGMEFVKRALKVGISDPETTQIPTRDALIALVDVLDTFINDKKMELDS